VESVIHSRNLTPGPGRQLVFVYTTKVGFSRNVVSRVGLDTWIREKKIPSAVMDDLLRRNPDRKQLFLTRCQPSNPNILVRSLSQVDQDLGFCSQFPDARGYVESFLPGYSRDGRTALVLFSFGPTPHGAIGCYLLSKTNGRWEIIERSIGNFD